MIEFKQINKTFDGGNNFSVKDLNLEVQDGEFLVFLGSSGSGKTTTLRMINRLIEPSSGEILLDGTSIKALNPVDLRRSIGYVFQGIGLFPHMTIAENVAVVPGLLKWSKPRIQERVRELLELIELPIEKFGERLPEQLSGGQQQRVGVARALAADPNYLLMDEPFGALDPVTREKLQNELLSIKKRVNKTFIFVTHDLFEALTLADRIVIFHNGVMQQADTPKKIMAAPATEFVRELFARPAKQLSDFRDMI